MKPQFIDHEQSQRNSVIQADLGDAAGPVPRRHSKVSLTFWLVEGLAFSL